MQCAGFAHLFQKALCKKCVLLILSIGMATGEAVFGRDGVPMRPWTPLSPWKLESPGKLEMLKGFLLRNQDIDSVRIMSPDRMPCRVPSMARVERMPVKKLLNRFPVDPMRNGIAPK